MKKDFKLGLDTLYIYSLIIYICATIITSIYVYANSIVDLPFTLIRYGVLVICLTKIVFYDLKYYKPKSIPIVFTIFILLFASSIVSGNRTLFQLYILILGGYRVDFDKLSKKVLIFEGGFIGIIILLSLLGIIPNREFTRAGQSVIRYSLGFKFTTYPALLAWSLSTVYLYLKRGKLKKSDYFWVLIVNLFFYILTDTRNELFCSVLTLIVFGLHQHGYLKKFYRLTEFVGKYFMIGLVLLSITLAFTYKYSNPILRQLNIFMSNRLHLAQKGMENYGITLLGNDIAWVGLSDVYEQTAKQKEFNYVDNSYLNILYQYGILVLMLVTYGYYKLSKNAAKEKDYYLLYILIILYFHSFLNPQLLLISYNLFVLKFADVLLPKIKLNQIKKSSEKEKYMTLDEIHAEQIQMFKKITKYLDKNQLRYFICGGTLLGAIRHKGFIPWDDDIDILMPRPDYDKLQKLSIDFKIADNLELHSFELNNLNDPFCKIYNLDTEMEKYYSDDEYDNHMWIDIFPMDGLPDSQKKINKTFKKSLRYRQLLKLRKVREEIMVKESKTYAKAIAKPFLKILIDLMPKKFYVRKIDKLCRKYPYDSANFVGGIAWGYGPQEALPREEVNKIVKVEFENMKVKTFSCWDKYLKNLYKDYMKLPPKDKRVAHVMQIKKIERSVPVR